MPRSATRIKPSAAIAALRVNDETGAAEAFRSHGAAAVGAVPPKAPDRQTIPAKAGDPPRPDVGRTTGRASATCVSSLAAQAAQLAPAGEPGGGSFAGGLSDSKGGRGLRRTFNQEERELLARVANGEIGRQAASRLLRTNYTTLATYLRESGLTIRPYHRRAPATPKIEAPNGWFPIAHGNSGNWREYEGTPISLEAARRAVADGVATMAQKRVDGEFDLLFRARGKIAL